MTMITMNGVTLPIGAWSERYDIPAATIEGRLKRGWIVERAIAWPTVEKLKAKYPTPQPAPCAAPRRKPKPDLELITFNGETRTASEWAARLGISRSGLMSRFERGWPIEKALTAKPPSQIEFEGEKLTLSEWARRIGVNRQTLFARINQMGWSVERALTEPLQPRRRPQAY